METSKSIKSDEEFDMTAEFTDDNGQPAEPNGTVTASSDDTQIAIVFPLPDGRKWTVRATGQFEGTATVTISDGTISAKCVVDVSAVPHPKNATQIVLTAGDARKKPTQ